ncbi:flocculation protein FLO11-like [Drosophila busckii]|uniref:flocculation protein FLO11-like n=1 Tax=Drosophila busckii TaxID=30019 RepID=UPI001432FB8B|nr:flocculation protein FLO11-like [Drosophila busckii]XP_033151000.1 flocculation protein FLO11-like [Drosophila busckii]
MYVIYPADELILMTYGYFAPRVSPRPTLDCLREPLVPIEFPNRSSSSNSNSNNPQSNSNTVDTVDAAAATSSSSNQNDDSFALQWTGVSTAAQSIPPRIPCVLAAPTPANSPTQQTLAPLAAPPTPNFFSFEQSAPESATSHHTRRISRTSRASLTHSNQNSAGSKRSSVRSSSRAPPLTPLLTAQRPLSAPMYNDTSMQQGTGSSSSTARAPFQRSSAYDEEQQLPQQEQQQQLLSDTRSRSPSIFLEPPTPDPTHAHFGPGWGRPMSPMDLPPEHTSNSSKSPSGSKSRLRPKLHIPLGRLGRSTSSDTRERESSRLREDVHVHVENPVFSSENLRQNNFDAFFEAREPVIKLKPRTPHTAPAGVDVPLERYAGVYDSPRTRSAASSSAGGLFARSPREEREHALNARSRSADHWDEAGATGSGAGGAAGAAGGGAPSKGDRFFGKIFKWSKKS